MEEAQESLEQKVLHIKERIDSEKACKNVLYKMLELCKEPKDIENIEKQTLKFSEMKAPFQTPQVLLAWLIECGAMDIADGSDPIYRISQAGNEALKQEKSRDKLGALFVKESAYEDVLKELVKFCAAPKTRKEIDDKFTSHPLLQEPKIYPSYFVGLLEEVGALEWDGGWSATKDALRKVGE